MYSPILSKYGPAKCSKQILSLPVFDRSSISWIQALGRKNGWRHRYRFSCLGSWHWSLTVLLRRYFHESESLWYERYEISCLMVHKKLWVSKTLFLYLNFKNWNKKTFLRKMVRLIYLKLCSDFDSRKSRIFTWQSNLCPALVSDCLITFLTGWVSR